MLLTQGRYHIRASCKKTLEELSMIAYDEKAEDDKSKLVKQDDHTWDADIMPLHLLEMIIQSIREVVFNLFS